MKVIICFLLVVLSSIEVGAQVGYTGFRYQGILTNSSGAPISQKDVKIESTISIDGSSVYVENQKLKTDTFGRFSMTIGRGNVTSSLDFEEIDWSTGVLTVSLLVDTSGFSIGPLFPIGPDTIFAVPYALNALNTNSKSKFSTPWIFNTDWTNNLLGNAPGDTLVHNLDAPLSELVVKIFYSFGGTDFQSWEVGPGTSEANGSPGHYGVTYQHVSNNSIRIVTSWEGILYIDYSGFAQVLTLQPAFYKVVIYKL